MNKGFEEGYRVGVEDTLNEVDNSFQQLINSIQNKLDMSDMKALNNFIGTLHRLQMHNN